MSASEGLGYGLHISLDGDHANEEQLTLGGAAQDILRRMILLVEPDALSPVAALFDAGDEGLSAALILGETAGVVHTFPRTRTVNLQLFSAHDLSLSTTLKLFLDAYQVGRFRSSVREFGRYLPREEEELKRAVAGERAYVRLRLLPAPVVTEE